MLHNNIASMSQQLKTDRYADKNRQREVTSKKTGCLRSRVVSLASCLRRSRFWASISVLVSCSMALRACRRLEKQQDKYFIQTLSGKTTGQKFIQTLCGQTTGQTFQTDPVWSDNRTNISFWPCLVRQQDKHFILTLSGQTTGQTFHTDPVW